jgi:hypothetical protein
MMRDIRAEGALDGVRGATTNDEEADMSDDDVKRVDEDTPTGEDDSAEQGAGASPLPTDTEHTDDPKSGGTPVHPSPGNEG